MPRATLLGSMSSSQRHESDRKNLSCHNCSVGVFFDEQQMLGEKRRTDRDHHPPASLELADERRRHMAGSGGNDDGVEGPAIFPAVVAVARFRSNSRVPLLLQPSLRLGGERLDD